MFVFISIESQAQSQSICALSSATLTPPVSTTGATLNPGNFSPNLNGVFVVSPTITTTYSIITTIASGTPNVNTLTTTVNKVTVNPIPQVAPTFTQSSCTNTTNCFNLNLTFFPASPPPTYTITWFDWFKVPPWIPAGVTTPTQYSACGGISAGIYAGTITVSGGCSIPFQFTINPIPAPASFSTIPASSTQSITCHQPTLTISTSNSNLTYTWQSAVLGSVTASSISLTSANSGTLKVMATNTLTGCTDTKTLNLVTIPNPTITLSSSNPTICSGETVTLTAVGAVSYTWGTGQNSHQIIVSPSVTTSYSSSGRDNIACETSATITQGVNMCTALFNPLIHQPQLSVYPNPTSGYFSLETNESNSVEFSIMNYVGEIVLEGILQNKKNELDFTNYSKGIYFIKLHSVAPNTKITKLFKILLF